MIQALVIVFVILVFLFGFVVWFGAPYLPILKPQLNTAFDLLQLKPGQTLLELGCGDGRVLKAAAKRDLYAIGYELNPLLVIIARIHTWKYRKMVRVIWGNYWTATWPPADGIFVFLLDKYMLRLDKKIVQWKHNSVKLVSYAFQVSTKKPTKKANGLFLYTYSDHLRG